MTAGEESTSDPTLLRVSSTSHVARCISHSHQNRINHDHDINQAMVTGTNTQQAVATGSNDVDESLSSIASLEALPIGHLNAANTQAGLDIGAMVS